MKHEAYILKHVSRFKIQDSHRGFTLIEVLVGTFLVLLVFVGIVGAYRLGVKLVDSSKNKIAATAIAAGQMEKIKNLPYEAIGTKNAVLPYAGGILDVSTTTVRNNVEFTTEVAIKYISDEADGAGGADACNLDYKRVEVKTFWSGSLNGEVKLATDIAPKDLVKELNSCTVQPAGILSIQIFDAVGGMIPASFIEIFNPLTGVKITDVYASETGKADIPLATSTYKIVVSKAGYSSESTHASGDLYNGKIVITPEKPHSIVLEGQLIQHSFSVDRTGSFDVDTLSTWGTDYFSDSFGDESKISATSTVIVDNGAINLASTTETGYASSGYVVSKTITPLNLDKWQEFSWNDFEELATTTIKYQVLYWNGLNWTLVSDADLAGNNAGFDNSPVNLMSLATTTYLELRLKANLSTSDASTTPAVYSWQISWRSSNATAIANASFNLQGAKIVGLDANEQPIYKYSSSHTTNSSGHKDISNLEWDSYVFSVEPATGLDLIGTDPSSQPIGLNPNTALAVKLYLDSQNSLLATVQDLDTLEPIFSATVRLYKTDYDNTQYTDGKGQTLFIPLIASAYNLEVQAPGYSSASTNVSINGDNIKTIKLQRIE